MSSRKALTNEILSRIRALHRSCRCSVHVCLQEFLFFFLWRRNPDVITAGPRNFQGTHRWNSSQTQTSVQCTIQKTFKYFVLVGDMGTVEDTRNEKYPLFCPSLCTGISPMNYLTVSTDLHFSPEYMVYMYQFMCIYRYISGIARRMSHALKLDI